MTFFISFHFFKFIPSKTITQSSLIFNMDSSIGGQSRPVKILWRCSPKGNFTLAHIYALIQLKIFCDKGFQCTILISDLDAFLDKLKCPWQDLKVFLNFFLNSNNFVETNRKSFEDIKTTYKSFGNGRCVYLFV